MSALDTEQSLEKPDAKPFHKRIKLRYIAPTLIAVTLLVISFIFAFQKKFPLLKSKDILTKSMNAFGASLFILATVVNIVLLATVVKSRDQDIEKSPSILYASVAVFVFSIFYSGHRAFFMLYPAYVGPFPDCNASMTTVHLSYVSMKFVLALFYTFRVDVSFAKSSLRITPGAMLALRGFVAVSYGTMLILWATFFKGVPHGSLCIPARNPFVLILFFVVDALVCGILLYLFLDKLSSTRKFYKGSITLKLVYMKHAYLSILAIVSTWVFSLVGVIIGIEFILVPLDVMTNSFCVFLMFSFNKKLYRLMCELPCLRLGLYNHDKIPEWVNPERSEMDAHNSQLASASPNSSRNNTSRTSSSPDQAKALDEESAC